MKLLVGVVIATASLIPATANATAPVVATEISGIPIDPNDPAWDEFRWQRAHGAPPIKFWETIAHCETRQNWQNPGRWAGGLGIMTTKTFPNKGMGTWERWGGEQFAARPNHATPLQQIVVANRIAMFGYEATYRRWNGKHQRVVQANYKKYPTGFNGWGCISMRRATHKDHNPARFESRRPRPMITYKIHNPANVGLNIPRWAKDRIPADRLR